MNSSPKDSGPSQEIVEKGTTSTNKKASVQLNRESIVICGISARLPESANLEEFADHLFNGVDMVTEDSHRWPSGIYGTPRRQGTFKSLDKFDALFFKVPAAQANTMDPQLRFLQELAYEAIIDAGVNPMTIRGSNTGVFIGTSWAEHERVENAEDEKGYIQTGIAKALLANRLSYFFDLKGPSFTMDTACSSSLLALHQAVTAIRMGDCDAALVGGINVCLDPMTTLRFCRLNTLSPDGRCKSFDASADGYVRSDGAAVLYIRKRQENIRLPRAYASIVHIKTNTDGYKIEGTITPSRQMQAVLMETIYEEAGISPDQVAFFEAHGTGTTFGDRTEAHAIADVFSKGRSRQNPLLIGSVKSNCGHPEPASGVVSIAKIILAMQRGIIPANLHYRNPCPDVPALLDGTLKVVTENTGWDGGIVGVASLGIGGVNVQAILASLPKTEKSNDSGLDSMSSKSRPHSPLPLLIPFSGRTVEAVEFGLKKVLKIPTDVPSAEPHGKIDRNMVALLHEISRTNIPGHDYRGYTIGQHPADYPANYRDNLTSVTNVQKLNSLRKDPPPIWFVFSGMGSQCPGVGDALLQFPIFEQAMKGLAPILTARGLDLYAILKGNDLPCDNADNETPEILTTLLSIIAIQIGLVDLMKSVGISPDGMIGHSMAELTCAYADGWLTAEQTIDVAWARGQAILDCQQGSQPEGHHHDGIMAAVGMSWEEAKLKCPQGVFPACHNSLDSVTVSGPKSLVVPFVEKLVEEGRFAKLVDTAGFAFHSKYIAPAGPILRNYLEDIIPDSKVAAYANGRGRWISTSIPEGKQEEDRKKGLEDEENGINPKMASIDYFLNNLLGPVLFQQALAHIPADAIVIEIAPIGLMQSILKRSLPPTCINLSLTDRTGLNPVTSVLGAIGKMYGAGLHPIVSQLYDKVSFPVPIQTTMISPLVQWDHRQSWAIPKLYKDTTQQKEARISGQSFEISLESGSPHQFYEGHRVNGRIIFPAAGYLVLVWSALAKSRGVAFEELPVVIEDIQFFRATVLPEEATDCSVNFVVHISEKTGQFEVEEGDTVVSSGVIRTLVDGTEQMTVGNDDDGDDREQVRFTPPLTRTEAYKELGLRGHDYSGIFKCIDTANWDGSWAKVSWLNNWTGLLDAMGQLFVLGNTKSRKLLLPTRIRRVTIDPQAFLKRNDRRNDDHDHGGGQSNENGGKEEAEENGDYFEVVNHKTLQLIQCPGVEMLGIVTRASSSKPEHHPVIMEGYSFSPYFDKSKEEEMEVDRKFEDDQFILRFCVEVALENTKELKFEAVEFATTIQASLAPDLINIFRAQVHKRCNMTVVLTTTTKTNDDGDDDKSSNSNTQILDGGGCEEGKTFKMVSAPSENEWIKFVSGSSSSQPSTTNPVLPELGKCHLLIVQDEDAFVQILGGGGGKVLQVLDDSSFFLYKSRRNILSLPSFASCVAPSFHIVANKRSHNFQYLLLRKKMSQHIPPTTTTTTGENFILPQNSLRKSIIVDISNEDLTWLDKVKEAMKLTTADPVQSLETTTIYLTNQDGRPLTGLLGLFNCLKLESGGARLRCYLNMDNNQNHQNKFNLHQPDEELLYRMMNLDLVVNVFSNGEWGCYFHHDIIRSSTNRIGASAITLSQVRTKYAFVKALRVGDLSSLTWVESPLSNYEEEQAATTADADSSTTAADRKFLCDVHYASVNLRDVLLVTGDLAPEELPLLVSNDDEVLGMEFSGTATADNNIRRVMGLVPCHGLATKVLTHPVLTWQIPDGWTMAEGATIPMAYCTAYYALIVRGRVMPGESVLIHSADSSVGQAAVRISLSLGCKIFLTVGSPQGRQLVQNLFPQLTKYCFHLASSAEANSTNHLFQNVMTHTRGQGVDIVLDYLTTTLDVLKKTSLFCLVAYGRFLAIGKKSTIDLIQGSTRTGGMAAEMFSKNIEFTTIHTDDLVDKRPTNEILRKLVDDGIRSGVVQPIRATPVVPVHQLEHAFRLIQEDKQLDKVLIEVRSTEEKGESENEIGDKALEICNEMENGTVTAIPKMYFTAHKSIILIGGLGGFGLELGSWLIERGARKIVLVSRSGITTGYQNRCVQQWRQKGVQVFTPTKYNVTTVEGAKQLLLEVKSNVGPLSGIYNLAMVLRDALFENQTIESFETSLRPKVNTSKNLDLASRELVPELEQFVLFSSITSGRGNIGQSNYGFANSFMERLCEERHKLGLPALAVQWGPIGDTGVILDQFGGDMQFGNCCPQRIHSCLDTLEILMRQQRHHPVTASMVIMDDDDKKKIMRRGKGNGQNGIEAQEESLFSTVAGILGMDKAISDLNPDTTLAELGLDSIMSVELKQILEREYDIMMSQDDVRRLTLSSIKALDAQMTDRTPQKFTDTPNVSAVPPSPPLCHSHHQMNGVSSLENSTRKMTVGLADQNNCHDAMTLTPTQVVVNMSRSSKKLGDRTTGDDDVIIFMVHPVQGHVLHLNRLAEHLQATRVYGLQCVAEAPTDSVRQLAEFYVDKIKLVQPEGPYNVAGYSYGCEVATEIVLQLEREGDTVSNLFFLDGSWRRTCISFGLDTIHGRQGIVEDQATLAATPNLSTCLQLDTLCTFLGQFWPSFDYFEVRRILNAVESLSGKISTATELLHANMPIFKKMDIELAISAFFSRIKAAEIYRPLDMVHANFVLIKAKDNEAAKGLDYDYTIQQISYEKVFVFEVPGNHKTFVQDAGVVQVAKIMNEYLLSKRK